MNPTDHYLANCELQCLYNAILCPWSFGVLNNIAVLKEEVTAGVPVKH